MSMVTGVNSLTATQNVRKIPFSHNVRLCSFMEHSREYHINYHQTSINHYSRECSRLLEEQKKLAFWGQFRIAYTWGQLGNALMAPSPISLIGAGFSIEKILKNVAKLDELETEYEDAHLMHVYHSQELKKYK